MFNFLHFKTVKLTLESIIDQVVANEFPDSGLDDSKSHNSSSSNLSVTNPFSNHNNSTHSVNDENGDYSMNNSGLEIRTLEETDAFLIFRSLCK
jgi:hypothetical protein